MKFEEKLNHLKTNHYDEWLDTYRQVEDELSNKQAMFCICGKLATGLHESHCKKFTKKIIAETISRLKHLTMQAKVSA